MLKKWKNLERQRPSLRIVRWGEGIGAVLFIGGFVGLGSIPIGLLTMVGFGIWGLKALR